MDEEPNPELIAAAELGEQGRAFLDSDLGRVMLGMARQEVEQAQEDLLKVDPEDVKTVRAIQNRAAFGQHFQQWLIELISDGESAIIALQQQSKTD